MMSYVRESSRNSTECTIKKTCLCNIQRFSSAVKIENAIGKMIFLIFLLKTLIVGTRLNRLAEAVLTNTHNLCFGAK